MPRISTSLMSKREHRGAEVIFWYCLETIISVSNTCAICSANQIILDCSSVLPPDLLFPYYGINDAEPIMPFHNWVSTYQGSIDAPINGLQANCTFLHEAVLLIRNHYLYTFFALIANLDIPFWDLLLPLLPVCQFRISF